MNSSKTLPSLVFFEAVARHKSFTKAADELHITQSAVSKQIKQLEESLGFQLFERRHRDVVMNIYGQKLLETTQPMLQSLELTIKQLRMREGEKVVSVVCSQGVGHYWIFPRLVEFRKIHPEITVNVTSTNEMTYRTCLAHDLGILYGKGDWSELDSTEVIKERIYPICSMGFDAPEISEPRQLQTLPLIQLGPQSWYWLTWSDYFHHFGIKFSLPSNALICNQLTLAINACVSGVGVALAWDSFTREMIETKLVRQLGDFVWDTGFSDYLVHSNSRPLSNAAFIFKDWLLSTTFNGGTALLPVDAAPVMLKRQ